MIAIPFVVDFEHITLTHEYPYFKSLHCCSVFILSDAAILLDVLPRSFGVSSRIALLLSSSISDLPPPAKEKHHHSMIQAPLCFVGRVLSGCYAL